MPAVVRAVLASVTVAALSALGCSSDGARAYENAVPRADAITNGAVDTTHAAVMLASCNEGCICTGTLVKKDEARGIGFILTAAHCIPDSTNDVQLRFFVQGEEAATFGKRYDNRIEPGAIRYPVLDSVRDPAYDPNGAITLDGKQAHDFGIVRVLGVGADTPVMALGTATDGLKKGSPVMTIGYGSTGAWNDENDLGMAGTRHSASVKVSELSAEHITVSGKDSGGATNIGDSGGPVVAMVDGVERVVGVHSIGVDNVLYSTRQNARVSSNVAWLESELAKSPALDGCNVCLRSEMGGTRSCATRHRTCLDDVDCNPYALCVEQCGEAGPTQECRDTCKNLHAQGAPKYEDGFACGCQACASVCGNVCPDAYLHPPAADAGTSPAPDASASEPHDARPSAPSAGGCSSASAPMSGAWWLALVVLARRSRLSRRDSARDASRCTSPCPRDG